jgi:hypothetical protein
MKRKLDFAALSVFTVISIALAALAFSFGGMDFNVYYAAARVTLQSGNPYDFAQLAPEIISTGKLNNPYYYAPWFTWSVIPFALFPYYIARILWALTHFALWIFSLINLSKIIEYPKHGWAKWMMWLLVTFVFAWSTWGAEQVGILILFLFTLILLSAQREHWTAVGIFLALILFKPNITATPAGMIALWILIRKRTWKPILVMTATLALFIALALILDPKFYLPLFDSDKLQGLSYTLDSSGGLEIKRYSTTLRDFLAVYGIEGGASIFIYAIAILIGVVISALAMYYSASLVEFIALIILVNFAVIPYALFYDYPPLTLSLFYGNHLLFKNKWIRYAANALIVASLFIGGIIPYRYWITVILAILLAIGYFTQKAAITLPFQK